MSSCLMPLNISHTSFSTKEKWKIVSPFVFRLVLISHDDRLTYWQISNISSYSFLSTRQGCTDTLTNGPSSRWFSLTFLFLFFSFLFILFLFFSFFDVSWLVIRST
jgi:hypothetical protein